MKKLTLSIVIPCLNESHTIKQSVTDAYTNGKKVFGNQFEVIVADNGSIDGTLEILKEIKFVRIVHVPVRGYGAALHWGILKSRGDYVLFADADLSYPFSNLSRFAAKLKYKPDMVLGSRLNGSIQKDAMPLLNRYFGTPALTQLIRLLYQIPTTDCNSGMRLIRKSFYKQLNMRNSGMEWASELLLKTALRKGKYLEVPIRFLKDKRNRPPHLSRWSDGWRHLKAIILLKPESLLITMAVAFLLAFLTLSVSFALTSLFLLVGITLWLSWLALQFLGFAIEKHHNSVSRILNNNWLVPLVIIFTLLNGIAVLILPDFRLGTKMILISINTLIFIWTFLIETIKTHLVNRLPD